jgi:hypothetical protein
MFIWLDCSSTPPNQLIKLIKLTHILILIPTVSFFLKSVFTNSVGVEGSGGGEDTRARGYKICHWPRKTLI